MPELEPWFHVVTLARSEKVSGTDLALLGNSGRDINGS